MKKRKVVRKKKQEQEKQITEFMETKPLLSDFENQLRYYENLEGDISAEEDFVVICPLQFDASKLNNNLDFENYTYAHTLSHH